MAQDDKVVRSYNRIQDRVHSRLLIPIIKKVLKSSGDTISSFDFLAVDQGPGAFTGLRISIAAIKGLSLAAKLPVIGFSSLDVLAYGLGNTATDFICPIIDAKRGQIYSAFYSKVKGKIIRESDYSLEPIDTVIKRIKRDVVFTGDAVFLYKEQIEAKIKKQALFAAEKLWFPQPRAAAKLCYDMYKTGKTIKSEKLSPMYLYADECTVNKT